MFRLQLRRLNRPSLALAGALIAATTLLSTTASAAPANSAPRTVEIETVATTPKLDLPVTDARIQITNVQDMGGGKIYFGAQAQNLGPDKATLRLTVTAHKANGTSQVVTKEFSGLVKNAGGGYGVLCEPDAQGNPCTGASYKVDVVNGLDNNLLNNSVYRDNEFGVISY